MFVFQQFVASVLSAMSPVMSHSTNLSASDTLAQSYGTMERTDNANEQDIEQA